MYSHQPTGHGFDLLGVELLACGQDIRCVLPVDDHIA